MQSAAVTKRSVTTGQSIEDRAIALLGAGIKQSAVALALGVSDSRISILLNDPQVASRVSELRIQNLTEANEIDATYSRIEKKLQGKLEDMVEYLMKPGEILAAIRTINGTQRRGVQAIPGQEESSSRETVTLNMPQVIHQTFVTNVNNQVIKAGEQDLITVQSSRMKDLLESHRREQEKEGKEIEDVQHSEPRRIASDQESLTKLGNF